MESALIVVAVAGFTQLVKSLFDRDYRSAVIITGSAVIGGAMGFFHLVAGIDVALGIAAGLGASGLVTISQAVGGRAISKAE